MDDGFVGFWMRFVGGVCQKFIGLDGRCLNILHQMQIERKERVFLGSIMGT